MKVEPRYHVATNSMKKKAMCIPLDKNLCPVPDGSFVVHFVSDLTLPLNTAVDATVQRTDLPVWHNGDAYFVLFLIDECKYKIVVSF